MKNKINQKAGDDIALYNHNNGTRLYSFNPNNITDFKSFIGEIDGKIVYLKEELEIMCGNEFIEEYVYLDNDYCESVEGEKKVFDGVEITIQTKKHFFARNSYVLSFNIDGYEYIVNIKTTTPAKVDKLMREFFDRNKP